MSTEGAEPPQSPFRPSPSRFHPARPGKQRALSVVYVRDIVVDTYVLDDEHPAVCFSAACGAYTVFSGEIAAEGYTIRWETRSDLAALIAAARDYLQGRVALHDQKRVERLQIVRSGRLGRLRLTPPELDGALQHPDAFVRQQSLTEFEALRLSADHAELSVQRTDTDGEFEAQLSTASEEPAALARLMMLTHRATFVHTEKVVAALEQAVGAFRDTYFDYFPPAAA